MHNRTANRMGPGPADVAVSANSCRHLEVREAPLRLQQLAQHRLQIRTASATRGEGEEGSKRPRDSAAGRCASPPSRPRTHHTIKFPSSPPVTHQIGQLAVSRKRRVGAKRPAVGRGRVAYSHPPHRQGKNARKKTVGGAGGAKKAQGAEAKRVCECDGLWRGLRDYLSDRPRTAKEAVGVERFPGAGRVRSARVKRHPRALVVARGGKVGHAFTSDVHLPREMLRCEGRGAKGGVAGPAYHREKVRVAQREHLNRIISILLSPNKDIVAHLQTFFFSPTVAEAG
jgi:hypothetical protein